MAQSPAALECRLIEVRSFGEGPRGGHVVFADVLHVAVDEDALGADGLPDPSVIGTASRGDRWNWYALGEREAIERPSWADLSAQDGADAR